MKVHQIIWNQIPLHVKMELGVWMKSLISTENSLQFRVNAPWTRKQLWFIITLTPMDEYCVEFISIGTAKQNYVKTTISTTDHVYSDNLGDVLKNEFLTAYKNQQK